MPLFQVQIQATEKDDCVLDVKEMFWWNLSVHWIISWVKSDSIGNKTNKMFFIVSEHGLKEKKSNIFISGTLTVYSCCTDHLEKSFQNALFFIGES
jgi:hypothetical protein